VKTFPLLVFLVAGSFAWADSPEVVALVTKGDAAEARGDMRGALALFRQAERLDADNAGVLLRISKQYSDLVGSTQPEELAQLTAEKALDYSKRAVAIEPKNAKARLSLAIAYGRLTDFVGNKTKLEYSKVIRDETAKSIELDPSDDFAWHVLGRWHFGVANVNGVLRAMAKLVYGGMPAASNEEAAKFLKKAAELAPQRIMHHAELAQVYKTMGKTDLAQQCWQNVLGIKAADTEDQKYQKQARLALDSARAARGGLPQKLTTGR
jgi:tetratricopeptide (TPR) repeat protein